MFNPAHDAIVYFAPEAGFINDNVLPVTIPVEPQNPEILGYTDLPETSRGLNNAKGFAVGMQGAAYNKRGRREPSITINIRPGNVAALAYLFPDGPSFLTSNGKIPYLCLSVRVKGSHTDVYRYCKPASVAFNFSGGDGQGGELTIAVTFQATTFERIEGAPDFPAPSAVRALGVPLMWHDVRSFKVGNTQLRRALMSLSVTLDMGLERKNERPNWGDDNPLSKTSYELLEHHKTVTGEMALHERLDGSLFDAAANSQDWDDIQIYCSSEPAGGSKGFTLTLSGPLPTNESMQGGESSKEIDFTIPFAADDIAFALEDGGE
jgi:hypothetical protein